MISFTYVSLILPKDSLVERGLHLVSAIGRRYTSRAKVNPRRWSFVSGDLIEACLHVSIINKHCLKTYQALIA